MHRSIQTRTETEKLIRAALATRPQENKELVVTVGRDKASIWRNIQRMRQEKQVHIAKWKRQPLGGPPSPVFALGDRPDAKRPKPMTKAAQCRAFRRRLKADPVKHMEYIMKGKIRDTRRKPPPPADPMFAWIPRREHV